jgi:ribosomal protein S6--L-glutamate ligase
MILSFHPCLDADVQIILGDESLGSEHIDLIQKATAIILPQGKTHELYDACSRSKALIFPDYKMRFKYPGKIGQALLFRDYGFPHPQTSIWNTVKEFKDAHSDSERFPHDPPFFVKKDTGHEAEGVYFVEESVSLSNALSLLAQRESEGQRGFVTQALVPCGGDVLRAVIIGKQIITYWKRPGKPDQVITTISRGAVIDHKWRPDLQQRGKTQAQTISQRTGINLAAIDFVFPRAKKAPCPVALEINYYFARRGLGGTEKYYSLLFQAVRHWLAEAEIDSKMLRLV